MLIGPTDVAANTLFIIEKIFSTYSQTQENLAQIYYDWRPCIRSSFQACFIKFKLEWRVGHSMLDCMHDSNVLDVCVDHVTSLLAGFSIKQCVFISDLTCTCVCYLLVPISCRMFMPISWKHWIAHNDTSIALAVLGWLLPFFTMVKIRIPVSIDLCVSNVI